MNVWKNSSKTVEEILAVATIFLDTSSIFKEETDRKKIKDLIAAGRFDLLLSPDYFDCDDKERLQQQHNYYGSIDDCNDEEWNDDDDEDYCVICFEDMDDSAMVTILECNHRFCTSCIQTWMANHATCPTCRSAISDDRLHRNRSRDTRPNSGDNMLFIGMILPVIGMASHSVLLHPCFVLFGLVIILVITVSPIGLVFALIALMVVLRRNGYFDQR